MDIEELRRQSHGRTEKVCLDMADVVRDTPTILPKKIEERRVLCAFASMGECPVAVLWVRRSETNRPSKCLEDTRGELARKGLTHRRMSNDSPKIQWSCQRVNEQVGVGIPRQFSGRDGLLDQVYIHGSSRQIETFEEESPKHGIFLNITDQADGDGCVLRMQPRRAADHTLMQPFERRSLKRWRQRRLHPRQKCVEHDRLLALPPTIQSGGAHAGLPGQFLRRY